MTADLIAIDRTALDIFSVAVLAFLLAVIPLFVAMALIPAGEKGWSKYWRLLAGVGCLGLSGVCIAVGISHIQEWKAMPDPNEGHAAIVQEWAETTYGLTVSDDEADTMASAIRNAPGREDETFVVEGASGIIEVRLVQDGDAEFHMVQATAELPLAEGKN